jgi:hypothetical protein
MQSAKNARATQAFAALALTHSSGYGMKRAKELLYMFLIAILYILARRNLVSRS